MKNHAVEASKFLSYLLRHHPEAANLQLDAQGWVEVDQLLRHVNATGRTWTLDFLREIVESNDKQRFRLSANGLRIRANQGHSLPVDLELQPQTPPLLLFHGTATRFLASIRVHGLLKRSRQHVHLSASRETAVAVGRRHGAPVVLEVDTAAMLTDGHLFYLAENQVWLTDHVPFHFVRET